MQQTKTIDELRKNFVAAAAVIAVVLLASALFHIMVT